MNHSPRVWWPTFRFMFSNGSWCKSVTVERNAKLISGLYFSYKMLTFWLLFFLLNYFSEIILYAKYFVLWYLIDVVPTNACLTIKHLSSQSIPQTAKNLNLWYDHVWVMGFGPRRHYGNGSYLYNIWLTYANFITKTTHWSLLWGYFASHTFFAAQSIHMVVYNDSNWFCAWGCK